MHRQHGAARLGDGVQPRTARPQFLVPLTAWPPLLPPAYGFQNGYKMRVYYLVQSNRPGIVSRAATRLVISIERPDPTFPPSSARSIPAATPRRPSPDLGSKPPPSAFIPAGGSGRHGRGPSLVTRWRARGSAPISRFSPHTRTGSPRFGSLAVSWVLRLSGQSASRLARLWIRGWRGVVRDRSSSHWAIRELRLLVLFALCFFFDVDGDMWRRDSELGCF